MTSEDKGRRLGEGFGTFTYKNQSTDTGGDVAGFTPNPDPATPAYHVNNGLPIPQGGSGTANVPAGTAPQEVYVWIEPGQNPPFWKCWKLSFDKPIQSCEFTNIAGFQHVNNPGGCEVSALAADGTQAHMVGSPVDTHTGGPPPFA